MKRQKEIKSENYEYLFLLFATIVFIDRLLKTFTHNSCISGFCILRTNNAGAAFGVFPGMTWFFIAIAVLILAAIVLFISEFDRSSKIALIFIAAGTAANMIDRIFFKYVIDIFSVFGSSSFNLADVSNLIGVVLLVFFMLKKSKRL